MNTIQGVEEDGGNVFEDINSNKDCSNQNLFTTFKNASCEKSPLSIITNHIQPHQSPKTRSSTKDNNFMSAGDFFGIPKKMLRRNSKYNNAMAAIQNRTPKKVNFKMPFAYIVEVESFKHENYECTVESYKKRRRSSNSSNSLNVSSKKSCCKELKCNII